MLSVWLHHRFEMVVVRVSILVHKAAMLLNAALGPTSPLTQRCRDEVHHIAAQTVSAVSSLEISILVRN